MGTTRSCFTLTNKTINRKLFFSKRVAGDPGAPGGDGPYGVPDDTHPDEAVDVVVEKPENFYQVSTLDEANLIVSLTEDGYHAPVIDFDLPLEVVPSSTPGHSHLYINHLMTWETYQELLVALVKAGLVEDGYVKASVARGFTSVRPPGLFKADIDPTVGDIMRQNVHLRQMNYELQKLTQETLDQFEVLQAETKAAKDEVAVLQNTYAY